MAVISLDFASVATWPKAIPSSLAQALTMCSAPSPWRRVVRAATGLAVDGDQTVWTAGVGRDRVADPVLEARWNASGLSTMSRRRMQSREGMPLGSARYRASQDPGDAWPSDGWRWDHRSRR